MAGTDGMLFTEVVREVLRGEHADVIRAVAQDLVGPGGGVASS